MRYLAYRVPGIVASFTTGTLLLTTLGCSFAGVRGPPSGPIDRDAPVDCTASRTAPTLDVVGSVPLALTSLIGLALSTCTYNSQSEWSACPSSKGGAVAVTIVSAAATGLLVGSAVYGFKQTGQCRDVLTWQSACLGGHAESCNALRMRDGSATKVEAGRPELQ